MENLSLDGVKIRERIHRFVAGVLQSRHGQWVEIEEFRVRRVDLGEDEVFEGNGDSGLCPQPAI